MMIVLMIFMFNALLKTVKSLLNFGLINATSYNVHGVISERNLSLLRGVDVLFMEFLLGFQ